MTTVYVHTCVQVCVCSTWHGTCHLVVMHSHKKCSLSAQFMLSKAQWLWWLMNALLLFSHLGLDSGKIFSIQDTLTKTAVCTTWYLSWTRKPHYLFRHRSGRPHNLASFPLSLPLRELCSPQPPKRWKQERSQAHFSWPVSISTGCTHKPRKINKHHGPLQTQLSLGSRALDISARCSPRAGE